MTVLQDIGAKHRTDKATFHHYLDFYEEHLPGRDFDGRLLEIGVMDGASLRMWRDYYPAAKIVGVDIDPKPYVQIDRVTIRQIDATDLPSLQSLGDFDVIIDDGSHMTADQQVTFSWLYYNQLNPGGVYVLEDLHTSYMSNYVNSRRTTIEFLAESGLNCIVYGRGQGDPDGFIQGCGFDLGNIEWRGPSPAESITAVIYAQEE